MPIYTPEDKPPIYQNKDLKKKLKKTKKNFKELNKELNMADLDRRWTDYRYIWKRIKLRFFPHKSILVNMELINGFHNSFVVFEKDGGFTYKGRNYIFDDDLKYYHLGAQLWALDYHENFSIPLKRKIPLTKIQKTLESTDITEVEYMTNPATLERFTISKIAEGVMKGQKIDEFFRQLRLLLIITMVASIIHLLLFAQKSGILSQVRLPF
jgi:hypothetical protein